jgi:hypothetical protein
MKKTRINGTRIEGRRGSTIGKKNNEKNQRRKIKLNNKGKSKRSEITL